MSEQCIDVPPGELTVAIQIERIKRVDSAPVFHRIQQQEDIVEAKFAVTIEVSATLAGSGSDRDR